MTEMSLLVTILHIFKNGMAGMLVKAIFILFIEQMLLSHLDNSPIYVAGKENALVITNLMIYTTIGFNYGLVLCISRSKGLNDYEGIQHFMKMHFWFMKLFAVMIIMLSCLYELVVPFIYHDEILKWTRIELAFTVPMIILMMLSDSYKGIYISLDQKCMAAVFGYIASGFGLISGILFGYWLHYGIWGI